MVQENWSKSRGREDCFNKRQEVEKKRTTISLHKASSFNPSLTGIVPKYVIELVGEVATLIKGILQKRRSGVLSKNVL